MALPQSAEKRKTVHSVMKIICREKKKQLPVLDTCNDHENYTQHSYRFFFSLSYKPSLYPQRVVSLEAIHEVCCVMVSCTNTGPASRDSSGYNLSRSLYFEKFSRFSESYSKYIQAFLLKGRIGNNSWLGKCNHERIMSYCS